MPPRSVLLNLSITAKSIEKERVVESVSEVEFGKNSEIKLEAEGNRERVDSATSGKFVNILLAYGGSLNASSVPDYFVGSWQQHMVPWPRYAGCSTSFNDLETNTTTSPSITIVQQHS
jgi:hypothetical protein